MSRTADGHPELQGMWTNYDPTPFERLGADEQFPRELAVSTADWLVQDSPISPRRPSMVVDPPNGRVPLKPEAIEARTRRSLSPRIRSNATGLGNDASRAACLRR